MSYDKVYRCLRCGEIMRQRLKRERDGRALPYWACDNPSCVVYGRNREMGLI